MRAICKIKEGYGNIVCQEVSRREPKPGEVEIEIAYAGICGTDTSIYTGVKKTKPPIIMGHEFSGIITRVGAGVTGWKAGDRVVAETTKEYCGTCEFCKTGRHSLCSGRGALGQQVDGVFAEYVCQVQEFLHKIPEQVGLLEASMVEPAAAVYHAVYDQVNVKPGQTAVVIGPGPMGQITAQMLKAVGAYVVIAGIDCDTGRLALAVSLGADLSVNTQQEDICRKMKELTAGKGVDFVFDCAGQAAVTETALSILKKTGTLVQIAIPSPNGVRISNFIDVMMKEISIVGAFSHRYLNWDKTLDLMNQGLLNLRPLATHFFRLEDCEEAFEIKDRIKVIFEIHPDEELKAGK